MRRFDTVYTQPCALTIGTYQQTPLVLLNRGGAHHDVTPYLLERFGDAYRAQIEGFVRSLQDGTSPAVTGADGLAALTIAVAATRSYYEARPVELAKLTEPGIVQPTQIGAFESRSTMPRT